jgi:4-alpha-glucanotransferase
MHSAYQKRCSGIFLHPTSLPSEFGIGDFGDDAYQWVSLLGRNKQSLWQICPLGPTGFGDSPYQCLCSFAGNTDLISPRRLAQEGLLRDDELASYPRFAEGHVEYTAVHAAKERLFRIAFGRFKPDDAFEAFCREEQWWLDNYALFRVIKDQQKGLPWNAWEKDLKTHNPQALGGVHAAIGPEIRYHYFLQYQFHRQWMSLKAFANSQGVAIVGDIPYYVAADSTDAWSAPQLFEFDTQRNPRRVGGVPPDFFSASGQRWGNPLYNWNAMARNGYQWWIDRMRKTLAMVDIVRIDHFRAFDTYWAIKADCPTAIEGVWEDGPGMDFFSAAAKTLGTMPIIAEDLGLITPRVTQLLRSAGFPGMKVLQFAFDGNPDNPYLPYNVTADSVVYTGTHDNDTTLGWYRTQPYDTRMRVLDYLGCPEDRVLECLQRAAFSSPARFCILPLQDVVGLDGFHRFNTPGTGEGNWKWRARREWLTDERFGFLRHITYLYGRAGQ